MRYPPMIVFPATNIFRAHYRRCLVCSKQHTTKIELWNSFIFRSQSNSEFFEFTYFLRHGKIVFEKRRKKRKINFDHDAWKFSRRKLDFCAQISTFQMRLIDDDDTSINTNCKSFIHSSKQLFRHKGALTLSESENIEKLAVFLEHSKWIQVKTLSKRI